MEKMNESNKVAIVTGAARRIGAVIATHLHARGVNVILHYNNSESEAMKLAATLNGLRPHSADLMRADLSHMDSQKPLIERAHAVWGRLDILVNNASRFYRTRMGDVTEYAWDDLMNSNLKGPFFLAQAAAPYLSKHQGCIVNVTDIHAEKPLKDYSAYCISKSGLLMATRVLAKELAPRVRVNAVAPGPIIWPEGDNELTASEKENIINQTLLERSGDPLEIAKTVAFLAIDSDYVTGQVINVDGGRLLCR